MSPAPPARHLRRARDVADGRYAESLTVADLAAAAGRSTAHGSRRFKQAFGESPHRYWLTRRLERAAALPCTSDRSVAEICFVVGLGSVGSCTTSFRRVFGRAPVAYRAAQADAARRAALPRCDRQGRLRGASRRDHAGVALPLAVHRPGRPARDRPRAHGAARAVHDRRGRQRTAGRARREGRRGHTLPADDCQASYDELSTRGIACNDPPTAQPYRIDTSLRDPSHNNVRLPRCSASTRHAERPGRAGRAPSEVRRRKARARRRPLRSRRVAPTGPLQSTTAGTCWVMQWIPPPPSRISRAATPTGRRPGSSRARSSATRSSLAGSMRGKTAAVLAR